MLSVLLALIQISTINTDNNGSTANRIVSARLGNDQYVCCGNRWNRAPSPIAQSKNGWQIEGRSRPKLVDHAGFWRRQQHSRPWVGRVSGYLAETEVDIFASTGFLVHHVETYVIAMKENVRSYAPRRTTATVQVVSTFGDLEHERQVTHQCSSMFQ